MYNLHWGLKYWTFKFKTHFKLERIDIQIWDGLVLDWLDHSYSYSPDHSKTETVQRNPRWQLFGQIWNGLTVRFWNAIQNQDHLTSEQILPFKIQKCLLFKPPLYSIRNALCWEQTKTFKFGVECGLIQHRSRLKKFVLVGSNTVGALIPNTLEYCMLWSSDF